MTLGQMQQVFAAQAANQYPDDAAAAGRLLVQKCKEQQVPAPKNPRQYVLTWGHRGTPAGNMISFATRAGRKEKLKPQQVEAAYRHIISWEKDGRDRPWEKAGEIARECKFVIELLQRTDATIGTLVAKIKHRHPRFGRHKLRVRWGMTPECQTDRLDTARNLLANYADKLDNVVQFDAKTVYLQEKVIYGYVDLAVGYTMSRAVVAKKQGKVIRLKYYGAVNAQLGPFFIIYYTGTTDLPAKRGRLHFKVCSVTKQCRRTLSTHMQHSLP
jgi:hypothetical protein